MFYKWWKYLAADALLRHLNNPNILTKVGNRHFHSPTYQKTNLQVLQKQINWFNIQTLRDAADLLLDKHEIDLFDNAWHIYDIDLVILEAGLDAAKERTYLWKFIRAIIAGVVILTGVGVGIKTLVQWLL